MLLFLLSLSLTSHTTPFSSFRISKITPHQRSLSQKLAKVRIKSRSKLTASGMSQYELLCKWMKSPIKRYVKGLVFRSSWKGQQQTEARGWGSMNGKLRVSPSSSRRSGLGLTEEGGGNGEKELVLRSGKRGREGEANVGGAPSKGWWSAGKRRWVQLGRRRRRSGGRPVCGGGEIEDQILLFCHHLITGFDPGPSRPCPADVSDRRANNDKPREEGEQEKRREPRELVGICQSLAHNWLLLLQKIVKGVLLLALLKC